MTSCTASSTVHWCRKRFGRFTEGSRSLRARSAALPPLSRRRGGPLKAFALGSGPATNSDRGPDLAADRDARPRSAIRGAGSRESRRNPSWLLRICVQSKSTSRVVLLDEADGVFIERAIGRPARQAACGTSKHLDRGLPRRRPARAVRVHDKRILVPAFVAAEPADVAGLLPLLSSGGCFPCGRLRPRRAKPFALPVSARGGAAAREGGGGARRFRRGGATRLARPGWRGGPCVKRVWSPIE